MYRTTAGTKSEGSKEGLETMNRSESCCAKLEYQLVFSCSGAADVGYLADQAARRLSTSKKAALCCVAAIGAEIPEIMEKARDASGILVIDGCDKECAKKILERAGFGHAQFIQLENLGMKKGETPFTEDRLESILGMADRMLREGKEKVS